MITLKEVAYPGGASSRHPELFGKAVYLLREEEVYFASLTRFPSSINFPEQIVQRICDTEGINLKDYTFFHLQTSRSFPDSGREPQDYCLDQLVFEDGEYPRVTGWGPVFSTPGWNPDAKERHLPQNGSPIAEIIKAFQAHLEMFVSEPDPA